jgi:hypothetical protein
MCAALQMPGISYFCRVVSGSCRTDGTTVVPCQPTCIEVSGHVLVDLAAVGTDLLVSFLVVAHVLLKGVHVGQLLLAQVTRDHQMSPGSQH